MDMMLRRRAMMHMPKGQTIWLYSDSTGRVEKAKIPVLKGQHIHLEWDISKISQNGNANCIISFYGQVSSFGNPDFHTDPRITSGYPIIWNNSGDLKTVFQGGHFDLTIPGDGLNMFVGYWRDADTTNRRLVGDWIKIVIT